MKPGTVVMERYTIDALAGTGGMSSVYRARDPRGRVVALKVLRSNSGQLAERFAREARGLTRLRHPAIVECLDTGVTPAGHRCLVMEWLDGVDLADYLARGRLQLGDALALIGRMARALGHAHQHGIVHRDVKPANIFLPAGQVVDAKLLDFGIARWSSADRLTGTGTQIGTPSYMAPEQIRSDRDIDARADVFSLGCVLFECLTRRQAFPGEHPAAVFYKILVDDPPRISQIVRGAPASLEVLLERMLAKDPDDRLRDGCAAATEIEAIITKLEEPGNPLPLQPVSERLHDGITGTEQHLVSVVLLAAADRLARTRVFQTPKQPVLAAESRAWTELPPLQKRYEELGARFDYAIDGSLIAVFDTRTVAADRAHDAARCALDLRRIHPARAIAVATGRALVGDDSILGEVIDRASTLLAVDEPESIRLDAVTSGLIKGRFAVEQGSGKSARLLHERRVAQPSMLLGQTTPFVGRVREMTTLDISLRECVEERMARVVMLTGASGMGKSRLKREFLRNVVRMDETISVWTANGQAMNAGSPLDMIAQAVRQQADILENEVLPVRQDKLRARVARSVPERHRSRITVFLGELIMTPWPDEEHVQLRAARRDARLMGDQIRRAVQDFLVCETNCQPVLLVLEDLQWSDQATVSLIDSALRNLAGQPFFILALGRPDIHQHFPKLWSKHDLMEVQVRRLPARAAEKLVKSALGAAVSDERAAEISAHADGNPLYLEELVRSVAAGRKTLPNTVLAMVHARLQDLPAASRRLLRAASIFGNRFWRSGLARVLGGAHELDHELETLVADEFFITIPKSKFAGEEQYQFRHELIREAAYGMLTDEDRTLGHQLAGHWLEQVGEADPMIIAEHMERGGEPENALPYLSRAALHACGSGDPDAAITIAERGVALGAEAGTRGALRAVQTKVYQWQGRLPDAIRFGQEAMALLPPGQRAWYEVAEDLVAAQSKQNDLASLETAARDVLRGCPKGHDLAGWFILAARLAWMLYLRGNVTVANGLLEQMESESRVSENIELDVAARMHATRACRALIADGNPAGLLLELRRAIDLYMEAGDRHNACDQQANAGFAEIELGLYQDAEKTLRMTLATADDLDLDELMDGAKQNLSIALAHLGNLDEARELAGACAESYERRGNQRMAAACRTYLAKIELANGNLPIAEELARQAMTLCPINTLVAATSRAVLARVLIMRGQAESSLHEASQASIDMEEVGGSEGGEALIRLAHAEALHANGRNQEARAAIETARARLLDRAKKIDHPEWRASFLANIPEHARTLELFEQWHSINS